MVLINFVIIFKPPTPSNKNIRIKIQRTYNCAHCLCGYETWSVTLREEDMLRVFKNGVLRRVFVTKWEAVRDTG